MDQVKEQAANIIAHAVKLGFPPDVIPDVQYLEKIVRSRNSQLFDNFLQRTDVKEKVECIRNNILINEAKQENAFQSLPLQLQRHKKYMQLKADLKQAEKRHKQVKDREKYCLNEGIAANIQKMKCEDLRSEKEVKVNILQAKLISLNTAIAKEREFQKKIHSVSPPKYSPEMNVDEMKERVQQCLSLLRTFYSNNNQDSDQLWVNIKKVLNSVPNIFTFQMILRQLDVSNNMLEQLISSLPVESSSNSSLQELLNKLSQSQIIAGIELLSLKRKSDDIKSACGEAIQNVTNELEDKMNSFDNSFEFDDQDLVGDYMSAMLKFLVLQGKYQHATKVIEKLRAQSEEIEKANKDYNITMQETQDLYKLFEEKMLNVQQSIAQIFKIRQKLDFVKISMTHLVQEVKTSSKQLDMSRMLTMTEDDVPDHLSELRSFLETPIKKFENISNVVASELNNKCLFADSESFAGLMEQSHFAVMSFNQLQDHMKRSFDFYKKLQPITSYVEPKIKCPPEVPINELQKQLELNRQSICELLDEITKSNMMTKSLLRENHLLYQYSLKNPLKNFIPSSKKFDGKSFKAYEAEFNLYYGMFKD